MCTFCGLFIIMKEGDEVSDENRKQPLFNGITDKKKGNGQDQTEYDPHKREFPLHDAARERDGTGGGCIGEDA